MGYCMTQTATEIFIPKELHALALHEIKHLMLEKTGDGLVTFDDIGLPVYRWFSWVSLDQVLKAKTLKEALDAWRWEAYQNEEDDISYLCFRGEKSGQDTFLFKAISPFVKEGSYICMRGEDGEQWRWYFDGKNCITQEAEIVWR